MQLKKDQIKTKSEPEGEEGKNESKSFPQDLIETTRVNTSRSGISSIDQFQLSNYDFDEPLVDFELDPDLYLLFECPPVVLPNGRLSDSLTYRENNEDADEGLILKDKEHLKGSKETPDQAWIDQNNENSKEA